MTVWAEATMVADNATANIDDFFIFFN